MTRVACRLRVADFIYPSLFNIHSSYALVDKLGNILQIYVIIFTKYIQIAWFEDDDFQAYKSSK